MVFSAALQLSSVHIIAIFVLIGFIFQYLQKKESKRSIVGSILIGGILGVSLVLVLTEDIQVSNIQVILIPVSIGIFSVLIGSVIAIALKKISEILKRRTKPNLE